MKYFLLLALGFCLGTTVHAQQHVINNFVDKYKDLDEVTHLNLSGNLLNLISEAKDEDGNRRFISQLEAIRVISINNLDDVDSDDISALRQGIQANNYEELIRVRDGKELVHVYLQEDKDQVIQELIVLVQEPEEFTLVSLSGEMYYEDLKELDLDGGAGKALENLPDRGEPRP